MIETINKYIKAGLPIFPCDNTKAPAVSNKQTGGRILWKEYEAKESKDEELYEAIGLRMGKGNLNLYCIDFDLKNTSDPNLFMNFIKTLQTQARVLSDKGLDVRTDIDKNVLIQKTVSKGYHIIFRCDDVDGNKHLAMSEDKKVVIETRGTGGYIIVDPSNGYEVISKNVPSLTDIPYISMEEKYLIENVAYTFDKSISDRYQAKVPVSKYKPKKNIDGETPWEAFDSQINGVHLLEENGWTVWRETGDRVHMTRPGKPYGTSGNWHKGLKLFMNFTPNAPYLPASDKAYTAFALYAYFNHNGDFTAAAKELYQKGYGDRIEHEEEIEYDNAKEYVYSFGSVKQELEKFYKGEIEMGKSTGSPLLDKSFVFKANEFYQIVGDLTIGKTFLMKYIISLAIRFAGWRVIIAAQENKPMDFLDDLLSFLNASSGKRAYTNGSISYTKQMEFLKSRVTFVKAGGKSVFDVLEIAKNINEKEKHDLILLDPLNGFSVDTKRKIGYGHEYHQHVAMSLLDFSEDTMSVLLNTHTTVGNQRSRKADTMAGEKKGRRVPRAADAEHGATYANKADTVIVLDRAVDSEDIEEIRTTNFWVKKNRNAKLGGGINPDEKPVMFQFVPENFGFDIYFDSDFNKNPLEMTDEFKGSIEDDGYSDGDKEVPKKDTKPDEDFYSKTDEIPF